MNKLILFFVIVLVMINTIMLYIFFDISKFVCGYTGVMDFVKTLSCTERNKQRLSSTLTDIGNGFNNFSQAMEKNFNSQPPVSAPATSPSAAYQQILDQMKKQQAALNK